MYDNPRLLPRPSDPHPGRVHQIGYAGTDEQWARREAGYSTKPLNIQGWDGCWATQMATNGGSRRPLLSWSPDQPLTPTRMTVPVESCRNASLNEKSYLAFARKHYSRKRLGMTFDQWVRELVNLGVPLMTGIAIDRGVMSKLKQANIKPSDPCANAYIAHACVPCDESVCDRDDALTYPTDHAMVKLSCHMAVGDAGNDAGESITWGVADTGASDFLHDTDVNDCLRNPRKSTQSYMTAGKGCIFGDREGELDVTVSNLDHQPHCPPTVDHTFTTTTVKGLGQPLWSLESVFRDQGYDIHLSHGYKKGDYTDMYRPPEG